MRAIPLTSSACPRCPDGLSLSGASVYKVQKYYLIYRSTSSRLSDVATSAIGLPVCLAVVENQFWTL